MLINFFQLSFPSDVETSMLIPIIVACSTPFPLLMTYGIHSGIKHLKNRQSASVDAEKSAVTLNLSACSVSA